MLKAERVVALNVSGNRVREGAPGKLCFHQLSSISSSFFSTLRFVFILTVTIDFIMVNRFREHFAMRRDELAEVTWLAELVASTCFAVTSYARGESNAGRYLAYGEDGLLFYAHQADFRVGVGWPGCSSLSFSSSFNALRTGRISV